MTRVLAVWGMWAAAILPPAARAQDAPRDARTQALAARSLAAGCGTCHGTDGRALPGAVVPALAGAPAAQTVERMKAFQSGQRPATVMHQIARGYTDAQIEQLARWFEAQPKEAAR